MSSLPEIYLARHGETAWSISGQHTGLTDLPLTERGERNARRLGERLREMTFPFVFTSHLQRAQKRASWPDFSPWPKRIPIWSNGITASTTAAPPPTFAASGPIGNSFAMAARGAKPRSKLRPSRTSDRKITPVGRDRTVVLERSFSARARRAVVRAGNDRRPLFVSRRRLAQHGGLRTWPG